MVLNQVAPDPVKGFFVIFVELLCNPLDAKGVLVALPDFSRVPDAIRSDSPQYLQICAVGLLSPNLKDTKLEEHFGGISGIPQSIGGNEGQFIGLPGGHENEQIFPFRGTSVESLQKATDIRPVYGVVLELHMKDPKRRNPFYIDYLVHRTYQTLDAFG
jgi:hypothetical protein